MQIQECVRSLVSGRVRIRHPALKGLTSEDEKLLRHFASGGNSSALQEHLRQLYARNSAENACSPFEKQLLCALCITHLRARALSTAIAL